MAFSRSSPAITSDRTKRMNGSKKTSQAVSRSTPCFSRLEEAFFWSHTKVMSFKRWTTSMPSDYKAWRIDVVNTGDAPSAPAATLSALLRPSRGRALALSSWVTRRRSPTAFSFSPTRPLRRHATLALDADPRATMPRFFNTAGPCDPADHYMLPPERRLPGVRDLIDR